MDTTPTSIADIGPGYIDKDRELILGLQNDQLFKLNFMPLGGIRMAETTLREHGYDRPKMHRAFFTKCRTTVNDGIFRAPLPPGVRRARHAHHVSGLPDS